ncbi:MAG: BamA/TamA family outer membrane protein, partial [Bacteroidota bacterium]
RSGESGYVVGLVDLRFRNLFGTGRRLGARWYRENRSTQELQLRYGEPWVFSLPLGIEAGLFQRQQDSTYVQRRIDGIASAEISESFSVGIVAEIRTVFPGERTTALISESREITFGGTIRYDTRDDPVTPTGGILYSTSVETGSRKILRPAAGGEGSSVATQRTTFDFEVYLSPLSRQVILTRLHARDYRSPSMELSDLFRFGGTATLRGYREGQFLGSRIIWTGVEYRLLVGQRSYAAAYTDFGYMVIPDRPEAGLVRLEQTRIGYGIGIRVDTGVGLLGVGLALGEGDTFGTAKLHFRLVNEF